MLDSTLFQEINRPVDLPQTTPTAAERQKRYRENKKRNAERNADSNGSNADAVTPPSPTERRQCLINGVKDFDAKFTKTPEEAVDEAIADGKASLRVLDNDEAPSIEVPEAVTVLCDAQAETTAFISTTGHLIIRQEAWPDEPHQIFISKNNISTFIDLLTDVVGIPTFGK